MKTLKLYFFSDSVSFTLRGFSFKKIKDESWDTEHQITKSDLGESYFDLDCMFRVNATYAKPDLSFIVNHFANIYNAVNFDKIVFENYYPLATEDELFNLIKEIANDKN